MAGLYIHVPFCRTKCIYCDFYSVTNVSQISPYISRLTDEIIRRKEEIPAGEKVQTIYFGGGTPSLLSSEELALILETIRQHYPIATEGTPEVTLEINPGDLTHLRAKELLSLGINRFSIGAQSFNPHTLRVLSRRHSPEETVEVVRLLREAGADNLTLDLIYGVPGTTPEDLMWDLEALTALSPEHISAYSLMYEEGTPLYRMRQDLKITEVDEETTLGMGRLVRAFLREKGYEQYEISNFKRHDATRDLSSHHNASYWDGTPYLGFGPSAHSYVHPVRSWNPSALDSYLTSDEREKEFLTPEMVFEEYLLTRLRTSKGITTDKLSELCTGKRLERILHLADEMTLGASPLLRKEEGRYYLTDRGIDLSDAVIRDLAFA